MYLLEVPVIAVIGNKNSGKTLVIETLTQALTDRGYRVATVKHIPEEGFTIDTEGTDTWRHARAGAKVIISAAPNEIAINKRTETQEYNLPYIIKECGEDVDLVILEGFKRLVKNNSSVLKIIAVRTDEEIHETWEGYEPVLAFVGSFSPPNLKASAPFINILTEKEKLLKLVTTRLKAFREKHNRALAERRVTIKIDGETLPLRRFVQEILQRTILSMVSTLKGVEIEGDEEVTVIIKKTK